MLAGQLFAVQLLLGAIVSTQMAIAASSGLPVICYGSSEDGSQGSDKPFNGQRPNNCVVCAFATLAPVVPEEHSISFVRHETSTSFIGVGAAGYSASRDNGPRLSQGPPLRA